MSDLEKENKGKEGQSGPDRTTAYVALSRRLAPSNVAFVNTDTGYHPASAASAVATATSGRSAPPRLSNHQ